MLYRTFPLPRYYPRPALHPLQDHIRLKPCRVYLLHLGEAQQAAADKNGFIGQAVHAGSRPSERRAQRDQCHEDDSHNQSTSDQMLGTINCCLFIVAFRLRMAHKSLSAYNIS